MIERRQYGVDATVDGIPILSTNGDFLAGAVFVAGDVKISVDGGAEAAMALPASFYEQPANSKKYRLFVSDLLMAGKRVVVDIVDQTNPKAFMDQRVILETQGDALSQHPEATLTSESVATAVDDLLTENHGAGSWQTKVILASASNSGSPVTVAADLSAAVGKLFSASIQATNRDTTDTTEWGFTVKEFADADSDDKALIAIRKTIAGAGDDGLYRYMGRAVSGGDLARGSIVVNNDEPDTLVTVSVSAAFMALPVGNFSWELTRWRPVGGVDEPEPFGAGAFSVVRLSRLGAPRP